MIRSVERILSRVKNRRFIENVFSAPTSWPQALLHYKTLTFFDPGLSKSYAHSNHWQILEIARTVASLGFAVDVVDRSENEWIPDDRYDLFISAAAGNSGWRFPEYARRLTSAIKVFYAAGPETSLANQMVLKRYEALFDRTGVEVPPMRVMDKVDIESSMALTDAILCVDGNRFSADSYSKFGLPVHTFYPSTSPDCRFNPEWFGSRSLKSFFCFAGNGFVAKGVDLVVEAFVEMPEYRLFIAGPSDDVGFWTAYGDIIRQSPNIEYEGFLTVGGRRFLELCGHCAYVILPAAAEGVCTSVATAMRCGLVPVTTYETGIDVEDFGHLLPSDPQRIIADMQSCISRFGELEFDEYKSRVYQALRSAIKYTQAGFTYNFTRALMDSLDEVGLQIG